MGQLKCLLVLMITGLTAGRARVLLGQIPLTEGLRVVDSYENKNGDFETIIAVVHATEKDLTVSASTDEAADTCSIGVQPNRRSWGLRKILRKDLENAQAFKQGWSACPPVPEINPGMTAIGVSARVLRELSGKGQTELTTDTSSRGMVRGTLSRIDRSDIPITTIVNDRPQALATVHARWHSSIGDREYWILSDPANPLILRATYMGRPILQVVKISFPESQAAMARVRSDLLKEGRVALYGLYFSSGSDRLRDESASVLSDIAHILEQNPRWSLLIEGHTDNVGSDAGNLDLSNRRALAVKEALVRKYRIQPSRLKAAGFGARKPRDTNDTLEGRARNRRVELVREQG